LSIAVGKLIIDLNQVSPYVDSNYPVNRVTEDNDKVPMGVAGTLQLVQNTVLSTQPISSFDWSPDKEGLCVCSSFDQMLRVLIVTRLKQL